MKKVFAEPEMQIIELNLCENIAASGGTGEEEDEGIHLKLWSDMTHLSSCTVQYTGKLLWNCDENDLQSCMVKNNTRSFGTVIPIEEALPYINR